MGKGRAPCCDKNKVKRGPWSPAEDLRLISFIHNHGHGNWRALPKQAGLLRCGKSCRLRWINYLRPDLKRGHFSPHEEETIINLHSSIGNKWSRIASHLPGRTDNEIKNVWNTYLKKRAMKKTEETSASSSHSPSCSIVTSNNVQIECVGTGRYTDIVDQEYIKSNEHIGHFPDDFESPYSSYDSSFSTCNKVDNDGGNNLLHCEPLEIPLDKTDIDEFWNILDSLETTRECSNIFQSSTNGDGEARTDKISRGDSEEELQHQRWLKNLEYELGFEAASGGNDNIMSLPDEYSVFDSQYQIFKNTQ